VSASKRLLAGLTHIGPAIAYVAFIFVGGSVSGGETYVTMTDKQLHAVAFGVMVPLLARATRFVRPQLALTSQLAVSAAASSLIGALLELWQAVLPHRNADVFDWVADTIGAVTAGSILAALAVLFGILGTARD
jgi:VanZ family protein